MTGFLHECIMYYYCFDLLANMLTNLIAWNMKSCRSKLKIYESNPPIATQS